MRVGDGLGAARRIPQCEHSLSIVLACVTDRPIGHSRMNITHRRWVRLLVFAPSRSARLHAYGTMRELSARAEHAFALLAAPSARAEEQCAEQ